jgi:hypothetical protein
MTSENHLVDSVDTGVENGRALLELGLLPDLG